MAHTTQGASAPVSPIESCKRLFGEHPEDVISPINSAAEALAWLEDILAIRI